MTQFERLFARIIQVVKENPVHAVHLTVIVDQNGEPLFWFSDKHPSPVEPVKAFKEKPEQ